MREILKYIFSGKYRKRKKFENNIRKKNPLTDIIPKNNISLNLVKFGKYSYGNPIIRTFGAKNEKLIIGNYVSIAEDVKFILSGGHYINTISTYPFKVKIFKEKEAESLCKGPIIVKDDVWIGTGAIILSGVTIGQGAVIGAGAVVTKDLESYGIYGGVPARLIKYRFSKNIINKIKELKFDSVDEGLKEKLYTEVTEDNVDEILEAINGK